MRHILPVVACLLAGAPALADVQRAVTAHILPAVGRFSAGTRALADSARADCRAEALRPAYQAAFDRWMGISHLQFGPLEAGGRNLAIAFWPDTRGMVAKSVDRLIRDADPVVDDAVAFADISVAGRGLFALERVLYDVEFSAYGPDSYTCRYVIALAVDLERMGQELMADWRAYAPLMTGAGQAGTTTYLTPTEAARALFTALTAGLDVTGNQRLGRPMGTFDKPRPGRAEAWRSGRSLRNVTLSLAALRGLADALADGPVPATDAAFAAAQAQAAALDDPVLAGVGDPTGRLRVEVLQQKVDLVAQAVGQEIGPALGVGAGFNALDGD